MVRPFGLVEMVRTGEIAIARGKSQTLVARESAERASIAGRRSPRAWTRRCARAAARGRPVAGERHRRARRPSSTSGRHRVREPARRRALLRLGAARPRRLRARRARAPRTWSMRAPAGDRFGAAARECSEADARRGDRRAAGPARARARCGWAASRSSPDGGQRSAVGLAARRRCWCCRSCRWRAAADETAATVNVICRPGDDAGDAARPRAGAGLPRCGTTELPLADPDPAGGYEIASVAAAAATTSGRSPRLRAACAPVRSTRWCWPARCGVGGGRPFNPGAVFDALRSGYPSCYCFCVGHARGGVPRREPGAARASRGRGRQHRRAGRVDAPQRRPGGRRPPRRAAAAQRRRTSTSTASSCGRSSARSSRCRSGSRPRTSPLLVKVANIQHLATPVRAQLAEPRSVVELAGALHPTSAVGGEPWSAAEPLVRGLEQIDRGWYAGPVGWMDAAEDGELCVALRCALLQGRTAHCYAGVGVVARLRPRGGAGRDRGEAAGDRPGADRAV